MKKIILLGIIFLTGNVFSEGAGDLKSIKALRMDNYPESILGTMEIQIDVKKIF